MYDYYLEHAAADIFDNAVNALTNELRRMEIKLEELESEISAVDADKKERRQMRDALYTELSADKDFIAIDEQKKKLEHLETRKQELEPEWRGLQDSLKSSKRQNEELLQALDTVPVIENYMQLLSEINNSSETAEFKSALQELINYKKQGDADVKRTLAELNIEKNRILGELKEVNERINLLRKKQLSYPQDMTRVIDAISEKFDSIDRTTEPRILCELLEITDDSWRNAVEGYLNTQRFYIIVEPESFDIALGVYDGLRKDKKAFGVGLVNTLKLEEYEKAPEGSLATVVTSSNPYAQRYINMILGKVHMCEHYNQLKLYRTAITKGCMKYQNHVASAIKPAIYKTPYIGRNAIKIQLNQAEEQKNILEKVLAEVEERIDFQQHLERLMTTETETDIKYGIDVLSELRRVKAGIEKCMVNIDTLEKNSNVMQKQLQLAALENIIKELEVKQLKLSSVKGSKEESIRNQHSSIEKKIIERSEKEASCREKLELAGDKGVLWQKEYEKQMQRKTPEQFFENFSRRKKANLTSVSETEKTMEKAMVEYKIAHDFGAPANMTGYAAFLSEYEKLHDSQLLTYEEKVRDARNAAEDEFREQFLSRLQENMKVAQGEFRELNKALKDITFSNEKYEFLYMPSKRYRQYYEMIMDDFNVAGGESIFSGTFHDVHKAVIDELFEKLAMDSDNNGKALEEFTDYRTYMDYDIKIVHSDGNYSYYSKVCEEKSGGETQTPFYVTVAASFVQLYRNNIGGEAIGLVLFDEAFNNMDDERIAGVLEFLRRLPLQIIIAAPPDKIQYISPCVEETQLIMTDEKVSFAERYYNGTI